MSAPSPRITAVICTHNRASYLKACVESALNQTLPRDQYELLVVNNASVDETEAVCRSFEGTPNYRWVNEPQAGLSHARNRGIAEAAGRYIGYLDDEARASETWLASVLEAFEKTEPQPDWVGGPIELEWDAPPPDWVDAELKVSLGEVNLGPVPRFLKPGERLGGGNSFFLKARLEEFGGFDTRLGRQKGTLLSGEETKLQHQVQNHGGRLYYHPGIHILHHAPGHRIHPGWFYKRYYWGGRSDKVMAKTLSGQTYPKLELESKSGSPVLRLLANFFRALAHPSRSRRIHARIYLAYVWGRIS